MKKLLLMVGISLMLASCSKEEKKENEEPNVTSVTVQTAGTLENTLKAPYTDVRDIKITGPLNYDDCRFISSKLTSLVRLDLLKATFANGMLPQDAFRVEVDDNNYSPFSEVVLPETLQGIDEYAFSLHAKLTKVVFPEGLKVINSYAFANCTSLTNVVLLSGLTDIRESAFYGCTSLVSVALPESLERLDSRVFSACTKLATINIPLKVTTIPEDFFDRCTALKAITLPANLSTIGQNAFRLTGLQSITLPATVTDIHDRAFARCASLTEVICKVLVPPFGNVDVFNDTPAAKTLKVPAASLELYKASPFWKENFTTIQAL